MAKTLASRVAAGELRVQKAPDYWPRDNRHMSRSRLLLAPETAGLPLVRRFAFVALAVFMPAFRIRRWLAAAAVAASIATVLVTIRPISLDRTIEPAGIRPYAGQAFIVGLDFGRSGLWRVVGDTNSDPRASNLNLYENGVLLGPAHTLTSDIRARGHGAYSHWENWLVFSSSDGSDPRTNGRVYTVSVLPRLAGWVWGVLGLFDLAVLALFGRDFKGLCIISSTGALWAGGAALIAITAFSSLGLFGLIARPQFGAVNSSLGLAAILHVALTCVLTTMQWAMGAGAARALLPKGASFAEVLLAGFPISIVLTAAFCALTLLLPFGGVIAGAAGLLCIVPLLRWRSDKAAVLAVCKALPPLLAISLFFGFWMTVAWHGPTAELPGFPLGDEVYYGSSVWALASQPLGRPNLANEGELIGYFNMLWPAIGASLLRLVPIDDILFTASASAAAILGMGFALLAYFSSGMSPRLGKLQVLVICLACAGAAWFPSWLVSSPQVAFVAPLTVSIWFWSKRGVTSDRINTANLAAALVASALTKVVTVGTLAPLAAASVLPGLVRRPLIVRLAGFVLVSAGGIYLFLLLRTYGPSMIQIGPLGPDSLSDHQWPYIARDAGAVLMVLLAFLLLQWPVALALSAGLVMFLVDPSLLRANFICSTIALALGAVDLPKNLARHRLMALTAFALIIPAAIAKDPSGLLTGVAWLFAVIGTVYTALSATGQSEPFSRQITGFSLAATAVVAAGMVFGTLPVPRGDGEIPSSARDIWRAVRVQTSPDSLIFTDQTGPQPTLLTGWNTYSLRGQRQIFLSDWYQSPRLRADSVARLKRLQLNEQVLSGLLAPTDVGTARPYSHFFAVVQKTRSMPDAWRRLYGNKDYALYVWSRKPE